MRRTKTAVALAKALAETEKGACRLATSPFATNFTAPCCQFVGLLLQRIRLISEGLPTRDPSSIGSQRTAWRVTDLTMCSIL